MTESEAISWLKTLKRMYRAYPSEVIKAWDVAIEALKEVQKYREIGTVEECRGCMDILNKEEAVFELAKIAEEWILYHKIECQEARERQRGKKPVEYEDKYYACPVCNNVLMYKWGKYTSRLKDKKCGLPYCLSCGQAIDWSE